MKIQVQPDYLIFADEAKTGELTDFPNIARGWGVTIDQTQSKPPMEWMNSAFNRIDKNTLYLLQQGIPEWHKTALYPVNAVIKYKGILYQAIIENDNAIPSTSTTKWRKLIEEASLSQKGIVQLSSAIDSDSETTAATSKVVKEVAEIAKKGGFPVGHIYFGLNLDASSLHLNGELYSRTAYAELWQYIKTVTPQLLVTDEAWLAEKEANNGICNKFSSGDGATTFRLPVFEYVKGGGLGYQKAGLPNIKGSTKLGLRHDRSANIAGEGALSNTFISDTAHSGYGSYNGSLYGTAIDASKYDRIYGSSDKVDLEAITGYWQIKAIGNILDVGSTDIDNMLNQINLLQEKITKLNAEVDDVSKLGLGMGQTWQNVLSTRKANTIYTNSTGKAIALSILTPAGDGNGAYSLYVDDMLIGYANAVSSWSQGQQLFAIVPANSTYKVTTVSRNVSGWIELR